MSIAAYSRAQFFQEPYIYFAYFDYTIAVLALLANAFVLSAIIRCSAFSKQTFYRYFLISLICSDLFVCIVNIATLIFQLTNDFALSSTSNNPEQHGTNRTATSAVSPINVLEKAKPYFQCAANVLKTLRLAGFFANLLSLCGMSLNHFLGMVYPTKYYMFMSKGVARFSVFFVWFISCALALIDLPINVILYDKEGKKFANISEEALSAARKEHHSMNSWKIGNDEPTITGNRIDWELLGIRPDLMYDDEDQVNISAAVPFRSPSESLDHMFSVLAEEDRARQALFHDPCTFYSDAKMWFEMGVIVMAFVCAVILTICYGMIIKKIYEHAEILGKNTKKSIFTTVMLIITFMTCWMPLMIFEFAMLLVLHTGRPLTTAAGYNERAVETVLSRSFILQSILSSLLMTYPLVDAAIYSLRIPAVKCYIYLRILKCCPCLGKRDVANLLMNSNRQRRANSAGQQSAGQSSGNNLNYYQNLNAPAYNNNSSNNNADNNTTIGMLEMTPGGTTEFEVSQCQQLGSNSSKSAILSEYQQHLL